VILLGLNQPLDDLAARLRGRHASDRQGLHGRPLAVGRAGARVAGGHIDDDAFVAAVARNFETLVDAWRASRPPPRRPDHAATTRSRRAPPESPTMKTIRLTLAQALVRHLAALRIELDDGSVVPYCGGVFAIFGHGNVAGLGEALHASRALPTWRAHNEQAMAHAAIAYAKANMRRRMMAVTTSIGPGATNLVTAAALAHVNRLPVLLLPGDTFASRAPDPVLQQLEDFGDGDVSANDTCARSRATSTASCGPSRSSRAAARDPRDDRPALCGPVCLALPQDVQAEAFDCPRAFSRPPRCASAAPPDARAGARGRALRGARRPLIVAGGGVLYAGRRRAARFARAHGVPVAETQAGKGSLAWDHPLNVGAIGVTGSPAANDCAREADLVIAVGTRLQDFTTGSHTLFTQARAAERQRAGVRRREVARRRAGRATRASASTRCPPARRLARRRRLDDRAERARGAWNGATRHRAHRAPQPTRLPYDADVIGAVRDSAPRASDDIVVCAAGTLPAELHKLWRTARRAATTWNTATPAWATRSPAASASKMARPEREVIVMVGDGSYLMMNSEIATSVMLGAS
jgi:3D-(3,5/4)-trihydroxycyclohexane-1,2-dione acylhydrolase (decyclizing)